MSADHATADADVQSYAGGGRGGVWPEGGYGSEPAAWGWRRPRPIRYITLATAMMPSPITTQPQAGTSVPESFLPPEAGAGLTVVVLLVIDVVCDGPVAVLVSTTVVEGPGTVTVRVLVEVTVSVDVAAGVVLAA